MARFYLIDELTREAQLPLASLDREHLRVISEVISLAWHLLLQTRKVALLSATEPEINALMVARLNALLDTHVMWRQLVRSVTRGTETESFDGTHLEKRPDLSIHLTQRNPSFPVAVECKIINMVSHQSGQRYCESGLSKFVSGEYGWAVREAFMVGYVRDESSISSCLTPFLVRSEGINPSPYLVEEMPTKIDLLSLDLASSTHRRVFKYPNRNTPNNLPGPILVWHLWLPPQ